MHEGASLGIFAAVGPTSPPIQTPEVGAAADLVRRLAAGRGVLLVGQRHSPGLADRLTVDASAALGAELHADLPGQMSTVSDAARLRKLAPVFAQSVPDEQMTALMEMPWAEVLCTAIDMAPLTAFVQTGRPARRVTVSYPSQFKTVPRSTAQAPIFIPMFGSAEEGDSRFGPPLAPDALDDLRVMKLPSILSELPRLVGPGGVLCVVGIGSDDWLPFNLLARALSQLPEDAIHWFQPTDEPDTWISSSEVQKRLEGRVIVWEQPYKDVLEKTTSLSVWGDLARARASIMSSESKTVTALDRSGQTKSYTIEASQWRVISRFGVLLDDDVVASPNPLPLGEDQSAFRAFLRSPQRVPDWQGVARGYLFERTQSAALVDEVVRSLDQVAGGHGKKSASIMVTAPPGTGKTRLLHWLAFQLKRRNRAVLYLLPSSGRVPHERVARACEVLEGLEIPAVVVIADGLEVEEYAELQRFLESVGRRFILVGSVSSPRAVADAGLDSKIVSLESSLSDEEADQFSAYLSERGFSDIASATWVRKDRFFLRLLFLLFHEARSNIQGAYAAEAEKMRRDIDEALSRAAAAEPAEAWKQDLQVILRELQVGEETPTKPSSLFSHSPGLEAAVNLALLCSEIDRPLPLDLMLRVAGDELVTHYREFVDALERTALLSEREIDGEGTIGVATDHPFVANVVLDFLCPESSAQVQLLRSLVPLIGWDESALPGTKADQDFLLGVLKSIGPNGRAEKGFESREARQELADLLRDVREHYAKLSSLMLLEGSTLRRLAKDDDRPIEERLVLCARAREVLGEAESIVMARPPTAARNSELSNILTTLAAVGGVENKCLLTQPINEDEPLDPQRAADILNETLRCTAAARSFNVGNFHPVDVAFWVHRDSFWKAQHLTPEARTDILARCEDILEFVAEDDLADSQMDLLLERRIELGEMRGDLNLSKSLAEEMRARGNYSGVCILLRDRVFDITTGAVVSRPAAEEALASLEGYGSAALNDETAVRLMNRLWVVTFLGENHRWSGSRPTLANCSRDDWLRWRRILNHLPNAPGEELNLHVLFCAAWVALQLEEYVEASEILARLRGMSAGSRRRVGALAVVTGVDGVPLEFSGTVRRGDSDGRIIYCPVLGTEIFFPRFYRYDGGEVPGVGEVVHFNIGLNYQGLTPWRKGGES